jgi:hypothetical protein
MPRYAANDSYGGKRCRGLPFKPLLSGSCQDIIEESGGWNRSGL